MRNIFLGRKHSRPHSWRGSSGSSQIQTRPSLAAEPLEERILLATLRDGDVLVGDFTFSEPILVEGNANVTVLGSVTFDANSPISGDGLSGADSLSLDVRGTVTIGGNVTGG